MARNRKGLRRFAAAGLALAAVASVTACSTRAPSEAIILYYKAGAGDNREFQECILPGTAGSYPVDDEIFSLPTSMRTWNIRPNDGDSAEPIKSATLPVSSDGGKTSQPGPEIVVYATADFYLNYDCKAGKKSPIVRFWETTGRRYGISTNGEEGFSQDNFRKMLVNTLVPAEEKALRAETRKYNADVLDANEGDVWTTMERNLAPTFLRTLREKLGGDFFCGTGYAGGEKTTWTEWEETDKTDPKTGQPVYKEVEKEGTCPPVRISITDIGFANQKIADARADVYAAEQRAKAQKIDAQGQADRAATLEGVGNSPGYIRLQEIEAEKLAAEACRTNQNCTVIIDQTGNADVTVGGR